jgi:hypothetical protein
MDVTMSLAEAAAALHDHFGARLEASHDEGRHLMIDTLKQQFGIGGRDARKLVDELEQARTIQYRPGASPTPMHGSNPMTTTGSDQLLAPMDRGSYWQIAPRD